MRHLRLGLRELLALAPEAEIGWFDTYDFPASYEAALTRRIAGDAKALSPGIAALDAVAASLTLPCGTP